MARLRRIQRELNELKSLSSPFQLISEIVEDDRLVFSLNTNKYSAESRSIFVHIQYPSDYPFSPPKSMLVSDTLTPSKQQQHPISVMSVLDMDKDEWSPVYTLSTIFTKLFNMLGDHEQSTELQTFDLHLFRTQIPIELRSLAIQYLGRTRADIDDTNIHYAVRLWVEQPNLALLRYGHISTWDTSHVTNMDYLFENAIEFNDDISDWDVSKVVSMRGMFANATSFESMLDRWDVSKVTDMRGMFANAFAFNQSLDSWQVSNVNDMQYMFYEARAFNQSLIKWGDKISDVVKVDNMFMKCCNDDYHTSYDWFVRLKTSEESINFANSDDNQEVSILFKHRLCNTELSGKLSEPIFILKFRLWGFVLHRMRLKSNFKHVKSFDTISSINCNRDASGVIIVNIHSTALLPEESAMRILLQLPNT